MRGVCEQRFEGLEYHQEVSIIYDRVEASNSCVKILSSVPPILLPSYVNFLSFLCFNFLLPPLFLFIFYCPSFISLFLFTFIFVCFSSPMGLSLAYPCLRLKGLVVVAAVES
jgi:hypothetical protein